LEEKDHHQKHKSNREIDPFSRLMFGNREREPREPHKESDHDSQEIPEQNEQASFKTRANHDGDWLFGRRREEPASSPVENFINNVDIGLLMETFETIVETTKQYKPIIKGIAPYLSKFTNKFKK
jgi:hypothetical protein